MESDIEEQLNWTHCGQVVSVDRLRPLSGRQKGGAMMGRSGGERDMLGQVLEELAALREENQRLAARVEALDRRDDKDGVTDTQKRTEVAAPRHDGQTAAEGADGGARHVSRRGVFKLAGAAAAGAAGASLLGAESAGATTGTMMYGAENSSGTDFTDLVSTSNSNTLRVFNEGSGNALFSSAKGSGTSLVATDDGTGTGKALYAVLNNQNNASNTIEAHTAGPGSGVYAISAAGIPVFGKITNASNAEPAVAGSTSGGGPAVQALTGGAGPAVQALTSGAGPAVQALTAGSGPAVQAGQSGTGRGIYSQIINAKNVNPAIRGDGSAVGRGGAFQGGAAQVRLLPASGSHPSSGEAGDLFLDKTNSLFLCKGGTKWVKLA
jgi:hypothetical protein